MNPQITLTIHAGINTSMLAQILKDFGHAGELAELHTGTQTIVVAMGMPVLPDAQYVKLAHAITAGYRLAADALIMVFSEGRRTFMVGPQGQRVRMQHVAPRGSRS